MEKTASPPKICLIDDDLIYQFTAKRIIELVNPSQKLLIFSNGKEAIDFFSRNTLTAEELPDVIFLDINMPVMNGWEFLQAYHKMAGTLNKKIIIYMVSSSVDEKDKLKSLEFNDVKDYIIKPIDQRTMLSILKTYNTTNNWT